jgi:hypothetical protein
MFLLRRKSCRDRAFPNRRKSLAIGAVCLAHGFVALVITEVVHADGALDKGLHPIDLGTIYRSSPSLLESVNIDSSSQS